MPFALTLFRRELDIWNPGEHNGTFRGNNHAFVTATAALRHFWSDGEFAGEVSRRGEYLTERLERMAEAHGLETRGRGMMRGIVLPNGELAAKVTAACFDRGLIIETSGADDEVVKVLAPLNIDDEIFAKGLDIVEECVANVMSEYVEASLEVTK